MSLGIFSPYGWASRETGFIMVLARFLARRGYGLVNLRCNGVLPTCGRDKLEPGGRTLMSCVECMLEQDQSVRWSQMPSVDLSSYFKYSDFKDHQQGLAQYSVAELGRFQTEGIKVGVVCGAGLGGITGDSESTSEQKQEAKEVLVSGARALNAFSRLTQERQFDALLTPAGDDYILNSLAAVAERRGIKNFRFKWETATLSMKISGALSGEEFRSSLYFDDIGSMRSNVDSWPEEIQSQLKAVEMYLGITQQQLSLPIV